MASKPEYNRRYREKRKAMGGCVYVKTHTLDANGKCPECRIMWHTTSSTVRCAEARARFEQSWRSIYTDA